MVRVECCALAFLTGFCIGLTSVYGYAVALFLLLCASFLSCSCLFRQEGRGNRSDTENLKSGEKE